MDIQEKISQLTEQLTHERAKAAAEEQERERVKAEAENTAKQAVLDETQRSQRQERRDAFMAILGDHAEDPELWLDLFVEVFDRLDKLTMDPYHHGLVQFIRDLDNQAAYLAKQNK